MDNANGYTPSSITESTDPLSMNKFVVIDEDDIFRYAAEETTAFRFIESFLQMDMKHILAKSVKRKDPRQLYQDIQDHFRGNQFHHVDKAIKNICKHKVHPLTPAFGEMITATSEGSIRDPRLGQLNIRALYVDKMHHNLLSVHQLCEGGESRTKQVGVFTDEGCRLFPLDHCRDAVKLLSSKPQTFCGLAKNGVYIYAPSD